MSFNELRFPVAVPDVVQPKGQDTDFWIRQYTEARQAELGMRRELLNKDAELEALRKQAEITEYLHNMDSLRELQKDKARLDWIESQATDGLLWTSRQSATGRGYRLHQGSEGFASAREAIDEAIAQAVQPQGKP